MDYKEAIEILQTLYPFECKMVDGRLEGGFRDYDCETGKAITFAISAMQELHEYKNKLEQVYGKCEGLLDKVINTLVQFADEVKIGNPIESLLLTDEEVELWKQIKKLGTLKEVRKAVEKQKAKKPLLGGNTDKLTGDIRICPCCCGVVGMDDMRADFCADCGQKLDWSEVEE